MTLRTVCRHCLEPHHLHEPSSLKCLWQPMVYAPIPCAYCGQPFTEFRRVHIAWKTNCLHADCYDEELNNADGARVLAYSILNAKYNTDPLWRRFLC